MCTPDSRKREPAIAADAAASAPQQGKRKKAGGDQMLGDALGGGGGVNTLDARRVAANASSPIAGISVSPAIAAYVRGGGFGADEGPRTPKYRSEIF